MSLNDSKLKQFKLLQYSENFPDNFDIVRLVDDKHGLSIVTIADHDEEIKHEIRFRGHFGYTNFDEADYHKRWLEIGQPRCGIYCADSSTLLNTMIQQSAHKELPDGAKNYLIVSLNDVVDIIAYEQPEVRISS